MSATSSQTAGPYWHLIDFPAWADLLRAGGPNAGIAGERITLVGRITDGDGAPAPMPWWRSGRPTPKAATTPPSTASAAAPPMPRAASVSPR
ncbi:hypothetical protein ACFQY5_25240 [Paeniroseomonas aquatica]|uniref:hypothetical protein n=1 Tax=Paeniroseomonas aquatica TaxID=373043 RepID=UPI003608E7F3